MTARESYAARVWRLAAVVSATLYLAGVWLEGIGSDVTSSAVPQPALYFLQIAALFPHAVTSSIDYRAEAWLCDERRWLEMDTRPYFAIDRENKENRFYRALHFFRQQRATMQALERYLMESHEHAQGDDGLPVRARIGGMRFLSLRRPIPAPGQSVIRDRRIPLAEFPRDEQRRWYWTPRSKRGERCGGPVPSPEDDR